MQNNPLQIIAMLSQAQNPNALMAQLFANNPQYQQVMQIIKGKSPQEIQQYATNLCQTQGIDIKSLARQFNLPL